MKAIILAAGQGKRMCSSTPKVIYPIMGKPILQYQTEACQKAGITDVTIVVGNDSKAIRDAMGDGFNYVIQTQPMGTGYAVQAVAGHIQADDDVLVLHGDMPLITPVFIQEFQAFYHDKNCAVTTAAYQPSSPYADWVNVGIHLFKGGALLQGLEQAANDNSQSKLCLSDVTKTLQNTGQIFYVFHAKGDVASFIDINTHVQLAEATGYIRNRINLRHMENGVRMLDPATTYIDDSVTIAPDAILYPGCVLEGACSVGEGAVIGPYTHMRDTTIGKGATVRQSTLRDATIGDKTDVGPFAHLRPGAVIGNNCRVGNFVEIKNADIGDGTKMGHLGYIGDADVGRNVNFSCGAITANYDGEKKHRTVIGDDAFIGCNVNLVAPVEVGEGALIAAGSTITNAVPEYSMGIARAMQVTKENWSKLRKRQKPQ